MPDNDIDLKEFVVQIESKLNQVSFNPENQIAVRFCVSQIILKAIALTKDPKVDPTRVKDLFDLASEILAQGDLKTDTDDHRLRDLINAMVEQDDLGVALKASNLETRKHFELLDSNLKYNFETLREEHSGAAADLVALRQTINSIAMKHSTVRTFFAIIAATSFMIFAIILIGTVIAYVLTSTSQLEGKFDFQRQSYVPLNQQAQKDIK